MPAGWILSGSCLIWRVENDIISGMRFRDDEDFLYKVLGAALVNNKSEIDEIMRVLETRGDGVRLVDDGSMYYNPGSGGRPGKIIIDRNASIGAWMHEYRHFLDDEADGFIGLKALMDLDVYWGREYNGYMEEYRIAESLRRTDIMNEILKRMEARRDEIYRIQAD